MVSSEGENCSCRHLPHPWSVSNWGRRQRWEGGSRCPPAAPSGCSPSAGSSASSSDEDPAGTLERQKNVREFKSDKMLTCNSKAPLRTIINSKFVLKSASPVWPLMTDDVCVFSEMNKKWHLERNSPLEISQENQIRLRGGRTIKQGHFQKKKKSAD